MSYEERMQMEQREREEQIDGLSNAFSGTIGSVEDIAMD
jgi:hypothetical protein